MTKRKMRHKGEAIRVMSGEHGTVVVGDGDTYPEWFAGAPSAPLAEIEEVDDEE